MRSVASFQNASADSTEYRGYFEADIFDCPPFVMFTNNDCPRSNEIIYQRQFEPRSMALWCRLARAATAIVDIGAHVGIYSLAAASLRPDLKVHAFEPNPYAFSRLRVNKYANGFLNIEEHPVALAKSSGFAALTWRRKPQGNISSGARVRAEVGDDLETAVASVAVFDDMQIDLGLRGLIKIDVEGAEASVFKGMRAAIAKRPDVILEVFEPDNCNLINSMIASLGYKVYGINEETGAMDNRPALTPMNRDGRNYNQFLTARPFCVD